MQYKSASASHGSHFGYRRGFEDDLTEYRNYVKGDDLRYLDWNLYARTEKYYVKEGYQRSRQSVFLWLDNSLSVKFSVKKYNLAWLLSLSLGYLFRQQKDKVYLYAEELKFNSTQSVLQLENPASFIGADETFIKETSAKIKKQKERRSILYAVKEAEKHLKKSNKIIWITDLYVPLDEFKKVLDICQEKKWKLSVLHITEESEFNSAGLKRGYLKKLIDAETGQWISSAKIKEYGQIWEEAVNKRARMLSARNFSYIRGRTEDGPIHILGQIKTI